MTHRRGWVDQRSAADFEKVFSTTPERAASDILSAILENRRRQLIGADAVLIDLVQRIMPTLYQRLLVAWTRRRRRKMMMLDPMS